MPSILKLTPRRLSLYDFIVKYKQTHDGIAPSVIEMRIACGIRSTSTVCHDLDALEVLGMVRCDYGVGGKSRMISVPGARWMPPTFSYASPAARADRARISSSLTS